MARRRDPWAGTLAWAHGSTGGLRQPVYLNEMERRFGDDRIASMPRHAKGGEWDYWRLQVSTKVKRRLAGGGFTRKGGMAPDRLAQRGGFDSIEECVAWYVRHALGAIGEKSTVQVYNRRLLFARTQGRCSYYAHRTAAARAAGFSSLHDMCLHRGWRTRKADDG